jgi:peptidoglycan/LPS O-acetylase OafA/YrhL
MNNTTAGTRTQPLSRVPEIDALRFLAALLVMGFHYFSWAHIQVPLRFGWLGVELFFMISGFVILWSALGKSALQFAASRVSRLYPSYWVCMAICLLTLTWAGAQFTLREVVGNALMLSQVFHVENLDTVYWTLYVEQKFYVLVFALLLLRQSRTAERWLALWLLAACLEWFIPQLRVVTLDHYAAFFISGSLFYFIRTQGLTAFRGMALAVSMVVCAFSAVRPELLKTYGVEGQWVCPVIAVLACHVIFLAVALRWVSLPANTTWYVVGSMTYPLYLIHARTGNVLWKALPVSNPAKILIVSVCSLSLAAAIAWWTERRLCNRLHKYLLSLPFIRGSTAAVRSTGLTASH